MLQQHHSVHALSHLKPVVLCPCACSSFAVPCRDPDDKQIQKELRALRAVIKDEKAATAKLFKGSLGSAPKQQPSSEGSSYADGSSNNNSQAAGGSAAAGIDAAEAAAKPPAAAVAAVAQSSSRSLVPPLLAVLALVAAVLAFVFGWLPGAS